MARLFTTGFEENNLTATMWSAAAGTTVITASPTPHAGTYAAKLSTSSAGGGITRIVPSLTSGTVFVRVYLYFSTFPTTFDAYLLRIRANVNLSASVLCIVSGSKLQIKAEVPGTTATGATTISPDTWYRLEVRHLVHETAGQIEGRLYLGDSATPLETWGIGNFSGGDGTDRDTLNTSVDRIGFGWTEESRTGTVTFDDIAINDASGSFQNSWPGPGKIAMLIPAAEGATIQWTPLSGTDNALMVDEMPAAAPDDATTYNESTTAAHLDILTLTDMPAEVPASATIILADAWGRVGGNATTGNPIMRFNLYDEADVKTAGPNCNKVDLNGFQIIATNEHCVLDTAGKTKANLDSFKVGYEIVTDTAVLQRVTAVWVNVEWLEGGLLRHPGMNARMAEMAGGLV
jgi:hypothetical protein